MLISRVYEPQNGDIVYHYCDGFAFHAICTNKKVRMSDLFSMNDFIEMHWGYYIWELVVTELLDEVGKDFLDEIDEIIHSAGKYGLLVASCYSLDGDVLSQWRAYADDGKGYAIGFNAKDLIELPIRSLKVLYEQKEQVEELKNTIKALYDVEKTEEVKFGSDFRRTCFTLAFDLAGFKNPAFKEEKEVRIVHVLDLEPSNDVLRLKDAGGHSFGKDCDGVPVHFRMRDNMPIAYIEQDFSNNGNINPIKEVIIGPKSEVLPSAISMFLETIGIDSVKIKTSNASYR